MQPFLLVLLLACFLAGLVSIPFGLPGLWLMVLGVVGYAWATGFETIGAATIATVVGLAVVGEVIEAWLGFGLAKRYGGSSRSGWGALAGGIVGAIVGVPLPVAGSVVGGFVGSFAGAALFEYARSGTAGGAMRAGWGALLGRAAATAAKIAAGIAIAVIAVFAIVRG